MSMLADRKQKQRWSLNPRGKHWSEDANKFGHKMLEKMGWSAGKGLGANLDGITEHVKVSYKNDAKGMGFKDNGEEWTKHENNFTLLLSNLSGSETNQISLPKPEDSLEKKSQSSKVRVHYHKFTRGKDLACRSEKDIANIFGRKTLDRPPVELNQPEQDVTENGTEDKSFGVVTVKAGNMADYFKSKLKKLGQLTSKSDYALNDCEPEIGACTGFGFSSTNENLQESGITKINFVSPQSSGSDELQTDVKTSNKKRKRIECERENDSVVENKKKKKQNKKNPSAFDNLGSDINTAEELCFDESKEQSKKKKQVTFSSPMIEILNNSNETNDIASSKKKKKKKNKQSDNGIDNFGCEENSFEEPRVEISGEKIDKKLKAKKNRDIDNCDESSIKKEKKKKKKKKLDEQGIDNLACEEISINEKNEEIRRFKLKKKAIEHGLVNPVCEANDDSIIENPVEEDSIQTPKKKAKTFKEKGIDNLGCEVFSNEDSVLDQNEVPNKKNKKRKNKIIEINDEKIVHDEESETLKVKKKKKSTKTKESGFENLGCEINTVEENIASINSEMDNYQTELENEINVKKLKVKKKPQNNNSKNDQEQTDDQTTNSPNTDNTKTNNVSKKEKFEKSSPYSPLNRFNSNPFDNQGFNQNEFNNQIPFMNGNGRGHFQRVDKSSIKHVLEPGELKLKFVGSNLMKLVGYGVPEHEMLAEINECKKNMNKS